MRANSTILKNLSEPKRRGLDLRTWTALLVSIAALSVAPTATTATDVPFPTDSEGRLVSEDLSVYERAMMSGGPGKDGIPSIDAPAFWSAEEADEFLNGGDVVFGLVEDGVARAYPQRILVWHEIVNDTVAGKAIAVTYCPLTGTAVAFERGDTELGVSGRLVNSNMVMYDRDTDTWFPQILATGIRGPHKGVTLAERPLVWTTWDRWRAAHPNTEVVSTQTGFARNYNRDPYGGYNPRAGYYEPQSPTMFPLTNEDGRLPPKAVVVGARTAGDAVAFRLSTLREKRRLVLESGGETFTAVYDEALDTGYVFRGATDAKAEFEGAGPEAIRWVGGDAPEALNSFEAMWFAWAAFYPAATLHE